MHTSKLFPASPPPSTNIFTAHWDEIQREAANHCEHLLKRPNHPNTGDLVDAWNAVWKSAAASEALRLPTSVIVDGAQWEDWLRQQEVTGHSARSLAAQVLTLITLAAIDVRNAAEALRPEGYYRVVILGSPSGTRLRMKIEPSGPFCEKHTKPATSSPPSSEDILRCLRKSVGELRPAPAFFTPEGYRFAIGVTFCKTAPDGAPVFLCCVLRLDPDGTYRLVRLTEEPHTRERLRSVLELNYALYKCPVFVEHRTAAGTAVTALGPSNASIDVRLARSNTGEADSVCGLESVLLLAGQGQLILPDVDGGFSPEIAERKDFSLGSDSQKLIQAMEDYQPPCQPPEALMAFLMAKEGLRTGGATLGASETTKEAPASGQAPASHKGETRIGGPGAELAAFEKDLQRLGKDLEIFGPFVRTLHAVLDGVGAAWKAPGKKGFERRDDAYADKPIGLLKMLATLKADEGTHVGAASSWYVIHPKAAPPPVDRVTSAFPNEAMSSPPEAAIGKAVEQIPGVPAAPPQDVSGSPPAPVKAELPPVDVVTFILLAEPLLATRAYLPEMLPDVFIQGARTGTEIRPGSDFKIKRLLVEDGAHAGQILEALARTIHGAPISTFNYRRGIYGTIIR